MGTEYTCAMCGGTFQAAWSEEEAIQETKDNFGDVDKSNCDVVCDDCYKILMGHIPDVSISCTIPIDETMSKIINENEQDIYGYISYELTKTIDDFIKGN